VREEREEICADRRQWRRMVGWWRVPTRETSLWWFGTREKLGWIFLFLVKIL